MTTPCWKWLRSTDFWTLEAICSHGSVLTPTGDKCDQLCVDNQGEVLDMRPDQYGSLPYRVKLWSAECGCEVDVLIDKDRRCYWLSELCVKETKVE